MEIERLPDAPVQTLSSIQTLSSRALRLRSGQTLVATATGVEGTAFSFGNQKPTAGFSTRILRLLARNDRDFYAGCPILGVAKGGRQIAFVLRTCSQGIGLGVPPLKPKAGLHGAPGPGLDFKTRDAERGSR